MRGKAVQWPIPIQAEGTRRDLCPSFLQKLEQWTCLVQIKCYYDKHLQRTTYCSVICLSQMSGQVKQVTGVL